MSTNTLAAGTFLAGFGLMGLFLYLGNDSLAGLSLMAALIAPILVYLFSALANRGEASMPAARKSDKNAQDSVGPAVKAKETFDPTAQVTSPKVANSTEDTREVFLSWRTAGLILFAAFIIFIMYKFSNPPYSGYGLADAIGGFVVYLAVGAIVAFITGFISRKHSALAMAVVTALLAFMVSYHQHTGYANFNDCMLQKMEGQAESMQRYAFQECRLLFPN